MIVISRRNTSRRTFLLILLIKERLLFNVHELVPLIWALLVEQSLGDPRK